MVFVVVLFFSYGNQQLSVPWRITIVKNNLKLVKKEMAAGCAAVCSPASLPLPPTPFPGSLFTF